MTSNFWTDGYCVVPDLIPADQRTLLRAGMEASERAGKLRVEDNKAQTGSLVEYKPLPGELVAQQVMPQLEALVGKPLAPTYSFWRIYLKGMDLKPHRDRDSCEISVSVPIHSVGSENHWPLRLTDLLGHQQAPALNLGDGLLYQGCKVKHWREPLAGERQYQIFLHYVIADGAKAELAFDRRPD